MGKRLREYDWAATSLGPPAKWPQSLKTSIRIMLMSRQPVWIGWGKDLIYFYNDPYFSIIGGKHPWAFGRPTTEVWSEIRDVIEPMLATAMSGDEGTYVEEQLLIMERNGYPEETYYTFSYSPIPDDEGNPGGIFCANTDDTQRVVGQRELALLRELAERTAKSRSVQEACDRSAAALATNLKDIPFACIYLTEEPAGEARLAASAGIRPGHQLSPEVVDLSDERLGFGECLHTQQPRILTELGLDAPRGEWPLPPTKAIVMPLAMPAEASRRAFLLAALSPYRLHDDGYQGFLNLVAGQIASAISDAEAAEAERRRLESLAELDRAKTTFFANVSHEFRTPLTLMLGPLQDLVSGDLGQLTPRVSTELETVRRNGLRLQKLVNALLDFSRLEAGRMQASFRLVDVGEFSAEIASMFHSAVDKAGLRLEVECESVPGAYVDPELWEKVVLNLVSNAFKHTFEGFIRVETSVVDGSAELRVRDTGIGISEADAPHIFERFRRVEGSASRTHEGSGIGLAMVQEIVRLHGGDIDFESSSSPEHHGTLFRVRIPLGSAHLPANQVREGGTSASSLMAEAFVGEALRWLPGSEPDEYEAYEGLLPLRTGGERIVIADDNADMREYLGRLLAGAYRIETVSDGKAALEAIDRELPDLVLTDVMMPRLDGFGVVQAIRSEPRTREIPVIMLSARAGEESRIEGLESGADDYLVKPFSARELVARVDATLALAGQRKQAAKELRANADLLAAEKRVLEMITGGARLGDILHELLVQIEALSADGMRCSVLLLDDSGRRLLHGAAPSLPQAYSDAIHGLAVGDAVGSCGTAAFRREPVGVEDIASHPYWADFKDLAAANGLAACFSTPIVSSQGELLGTVAIYYSQPSRPSEADQELVARAAHLAGVVIERDKALAAAEMQRTRLVDLFSRAPALVCLLKGPQHVFELANDAYVQATGRRCASDLLGKPVADALPEVVDQGFVDLLDRVYTTGEPFIGSEMLVRIDRDGNGGLEDVYMNFVYAPMRDSEGNVDGIMAHAVDVTEQVLARRRVEELAERLEQRVEQRTAELLHANEQLQGFTYSVAHDLRQQIRGINVNASMILHDLVGELDSEQKMQLNRLKRAAMQLGSLVDDLLQYAKLAQLQPARIAIDLSALANEVVSHVRTRESCGENMEIAVQPGMEAVADPAMLRLVLENLIDNACKYSRGVEKPRVTVGRDVQGYFVRDNGDGFDMQYYEKLFKPFERLHRDETIPGTGIGLANAKRIVERHGGRIWAESSPGEGATFYFTLHANESSAALA